MDETTRSCRRPACPWPATASLSYRYATSQVWLVDLTPAADPSLYDLCATHADATTVPRGWERVDERTQPAGADLATDDLVAVARSTDGSVVPRGGWGSGSTSRYDRLRRDLPSVAARLSAERRAEPVPSRDLAPVAFREAGGRRWHT